MRDSGSHPAGRALPVNLLVTLLLLASCAPAVGSPPARAAPVVAAAHDHAGSSGGDADPVMSMGVCRPSEPPRGAVPPAPPAWCTTLAPAVATEEDGADRWVDGFRNGLQMGAFPPGYQVFEAARPSVVFRTKHFVHNEHWMVDVAGRGDPPTEYEGDPRDLATGSHYGGGMVRPDRTFRFVDGRLVVEFDVAAGMLAYHDGWPELVVTTAAAPTGRETDPLHAIGIFGGSPSVGCRLYTDRTANCSAFDATGRTIADGGRIFELSAQDSGGAAITFGGAPKNAALAAAWRLCAPDDPDTKCRDRFRIELSADTIRVYANDVLYMEHQGLPLGHRIPDALLQGEVYVYFASWVYLGEATTLRFHWGRIAINP
jgi:hypothetical protein